MEDLMITVRCSDYAEAMSKLARVELLEEYVKKQEYSVDRKIIAAVLGFELPVKQVDVF